MSSSYQFTPVQFAPCNLPQQAYLTDTTYDLHMICTPDDYYPIWFDRHMTLKMHIWDVNLSYDPSLFFKEVAETQLNGMPFWFPG